MLLPNLTSCFLRIPCRCSFKRLREQFLNSQQSRVSHHAHHAAHPGLVHGFPAKIPSTYFFIFLFATLFSLLSRPLLSFRGAEPFFTAGVLRTLSRSFTCGLTPSLASAFLAFFFASLLATRSASEDLICLRSSFGRCASLSPREGSPFGIERVDIGTPGALGLEEWGDLEPSPSGRSPEAPEPPGSVLHRCTRRVRLANLSFVGSRARTSSTHSRSYRQI